MSIRYRVFFAVMAIALMAFAPLAMALDTPSLQVGVSGHAKQTITITAGASGAPNGFTVRWMDATTYWSNGGSFTAPVGDAASFTGAPTLNTFGGTTFKLAPSQSVVVEIGDLLGETGVAGSLDELEYGQFHYFTAFANDEGGAAASGNSNVVAATTTTSTNCTYTIGYWKNHEEDWPVNSLQLGNVVYTKAELLAILNEPVNGNGLISLAHQLIGAKLNIAAGADPTAAAAAIAAADAQIGNLVVPPVGAGYIHPSLTSATTQILDNYNNGVIGPGHCGTVATQQQTWGSIKALYR